MVPWSTYERDRAADERLRREQRDALNEKLKDIRDDIATVGTAVAEIKSNDRRRLGVLVASMLLPLASSLIVLFVTLQVTR